MVWKYYMIIAVLGIIILYLLIQNSRLFMRNVDLEWDVQVRDDRITNLRKVINQHNEKVQAKHKKSYDPIADEPI